ncbi:hypothetical protein MAR_029980, partial [Mya arenaria]
MELTGAKSLTHSVLNASDGLIHDFECSLCLEDNVNTEAKFFCKNCSKGYCVTCVIHHNKLFKKHAVLGRNDVDKWVGQGNALETCDLHPTKVIEMVCEDHMELCCSICVSLNHRMCHSISLVENLAKGIHELADFKQLPANVSKLTSSLNQVIQDMKKKQQLLKTSGKSTLKEIKALRDTLNQLLEELERKTVEQMDSVLADLDETIQKDIDSCTNIHGQLKAFLDNVQSQDKGSEPSVYIGYRKCQDKMADAKKQLHEMAIKAEMTVSFQPDNHVVEILTDMLTLGNIQADTAKDARNQSTLIDHCCNSIRHHEGQLYVGSYTALYLYTVAGQLIKVFLHNGLRGFGDTSIFIVLLLGQNVFPDATWHLQENTIPWDTLNANESRQTLIFTKDMGNKLKTSALYARAVCPSKGTWAGLRSGGICEGFRLLTTSPSPNNPLQLVKRGKPIQSPVFFPPALSSPSLGECYKSSDDLNQDKQLVLSVCSVISHDTILRDRPTDRQTDRHRGASDLDSYTKVPDLDAIDYNIDVFSLACDNNNVILEFHEIQTAVVL